MSQENRISPPPEEEEEGVLSRRQSVDELSESQRVEILAEAIKKILEEESPSTVTTLPQVEWRDYANNIEEDTDHLRNLFNAFGLMSFYINHVECAAGSRDGDNYMSVVKRVHIFKSTDEQSEPNIEDTGAEGATEDANTVIIKRLVPSVSRRQLYRCMDAFINEVHSYRFLVPLLNLHSNYDLCPKCFLALKNDLGFHGDPIIIMEDLRRLGFRMHNRRAGFDLKHSILVMQKLAQWHAAGLTAKLLEPDTYNSRTGFMREIVYKGEASEFYKTIMATSIEQAIESLTNSNVDGTLNETLRLIKRQRRHLYRYVQRSVLDASKSDLSVICHGDLWVNNIMFTKVKKKDNNSEPMKVIFYDLQAARISSAVFDILHFVYTSTRRKLRDAHINELISAYCDTISDCLEEELTNEGVAAELDRLRRSFTFERVYKEYKHFIMYGLAIAMWVLPAVTFDPGNIPNLDVISELNAHAKGITVTGNLSKIYHERMKETSLEFCDNGYLQAFDAKFNDDDPNDNELDSVEEVDAAI